MKGALLASLLVLAMYLYFYDLDLVFLLELVLVLIFFLFFIFQCCLECVWFSFFFYMCVTAIFFVCIYIEKYMLIYHHHDLLHIQRITYTIKLTLPNTPPSLHP